MTLPLEGIKVLDFSRFIPGPYCSMTLSDFGADVLWVEEPKNLGKADRRAEQAKGAVIKPFYGGDEETRIHDRMGCNKRSIILNLKSPEGQEIARQLAAKSDVVITEFRPGVTKRLGIDYEKVRPLNPRIIYCEISLWGQNGPYANYPGHDPCAQAVAGIIPVIGDEESPPNYAGVPIIDISSGLHAVMAVLLALRARDITGKGQRLDVSMLDSALAFQIGQAQWYFQGRRVPRLNRHNASSAVFQCKDGKWLCTTNTEPHHWANFCRSIGHEEFIPLEFNREARADMYKKVKEVFLTRTREEWLREFWNPATESQAAPVHTLEETFSDPQVIAREMVVEREHPSGTKIRQMGISVKLEGTPGQLRGFAPMPGQHTREVLASLGYSGPDIDALLKRQVVG